ncbi:hypothetical protein [Cohnella sp. GCM10027633]|uniref:hypothetical protein n=1 Tax=unclassified Cohnella TaxID=2636738 RepID=UPI00363CE01E
MRGTMEHRPSLVRRSNDFLFDKEIVRVAADAHPEAGIDAAPFLAPSQNEFLVAFVAPYDDFYPLRQHASPPLCAIESTPSMDETVTI